MKATLKDFVKHAFGIKAIKEPIFIKNFESENALIRDLKELKATVSGKKDRLEKELTFLKQGMIGEANVYYELKNSFIPMLCLHDIRLPYGDYYAQFDFIVITNKFIYILETKKLSGDIEINADGDFIRLIKNRQGRVVKKEGMYSPISQSERHAKILKDILMKEGLISVTQVKSAVILANPKTIINKRNCPKHISERIYKHDQIVRLLNSEMENTRDRDILERYQYEIAHYLVNNHEPLKIDYATKYSLNDEVPRRNNNSVREHEATDKEKSKIYTALKEYRLQTAKQENIKPYWIFTNKELEQIIQERPQSVKELLNIRGFGEKKAEKYGKAIIKIVTNIN